MSELFEVLYEDIRSGKSIEEICNMYGGLQIYIPSARRFVRNKIRQEFTGSNHVELARKYKMSVRQIYKILEASSG